MTVLSLCVCCALRPTPFDATWRLGCVASTRTGASFCLEVPAHCEEELNPTKGVILVSEGLC